MTTHQAPPRFGPLAAGGHVAVTAGFFAGRHGTVESVDVETDTIGVLLDTGSSAFIPQANAEPRPAPGT